MQRIAEGAAAVVAALVMVVVALGYCVRAEGVLGVVVAGLRADDLHGVDCHVGAGAAGVPHLKRGSPDASSVSLGEWAGW